MKKKIWCPRNLSSALSVTTDHRQRLKQKCNEIPDVRHLTQCILIVYNLLYPMIQEMILTKNRCYSHIVTPHLRRRPILLAMNTFALSDEYLQKPGYPMRMVLNTITALAPIPSPTKSKESI